MDRLRALWQLLTLIPWPCQSCGFLNATPLLRWDTVKYQLICRECRYMQHYPGYILGLDPHPPRKP